MENKDFCPKDRVEKEVARVRALTLNRTLESSIPHTCVEKEVARVRALTLNRTLESSIPHTCVEKEVARVRALTHCMNDTIFTKSYT